MIDYFALAVSHGLLAIALWRLLWRDDLDQEARDRRAPVRRPGRSSDQADA